MSSAPSDPGVVDTADTYGWDTVFAIHIADANAAIVTQKTSPPSFSQTETEDNVSASGSFGDWAIAPGGAGDLIRLALPFHDTTITGEGGNWTGQSGTVTVELRLDLLHDEEVASRRHLKVRTTAVDPQTPVVTVIKVELDDTTTPGTANIILKVVMGLWLEANLCDFDHVFSTVDLDRRADIDDFQWMQPTDVAYAYSDLGGDAEATDGALGILSMTGGRSSDGLVQQLSNLCIPPGRRASLLISKARVMDQILIHCLPHTFAGAQPSDFALSSTGDSIVNAGSGMTFKTDPNDSNSATASVEDLKATIQATVLTLDVQTCCDVSPGVHARARTINSLYMQLDAPSQSLVFVDAPNSPDINKWTDTDAEIKLAEGVLAACALVAGIAAAVVTDGAAIGVTAMALAFASGVMMLTVASIQAAEKDKAPAITSAVLNATSAIKWPHGSGFVLADAGLNDSLQLTGAYA